MIALCVFVFYSALTDPGKNGVAVGPFMVFNVLSGSMEPAISVGSMVVVMSAAEEDIKVGDVVTRRMEGGGDLLTHRVVSVENHLFTTRGDNPNINEDDRPVPIEAVVGKVVLVVPFLGSLTSYTSTPMGMGLVIIVFVLFVVFVEIVKKLLRA
jgi:signal peptidase I